jgi:hypothetical protein
MSSILDQPERDRSGNRKAIDAIYQSVGQIRIVCPG